LKEKTTLFILVGGQYASQVENVLYRAHQAAARDLLTTLLHTGLIDHAVVATDDPDWGSDLADLPIELDIDPPEMPFHFGRRLAGLIESYAPKHILYSGGGSAPLMTRQDWKDVLSRLGKAERLIITNNVHSCDWVGLTPALEALPSIIQQTNDNGIAWALANEANWPVESSSPSASTRFDLDTPLDIAIAQRHRDIGPALRQFITDLTWHTPQLDGVLLEMTREGGSLTIGGRVSEAAWAALERATRCWIRVFAEERGMRASRRQENDQVHSLLANHIDLTGVQGFFTELADMTNGILLDSRVIMAARRLHPSRQDRFNSDLLRWEKITDPFLRRFTHAAAEAQIPVVLGGHSIVAGGLMALVESIKANHKEP
jgi:hypothetical protein